jgi:integrative and conjugative element protein (TIGR02256 family)
MADTFADFGEPIARLTEDALTLAISRNLFRACAEHKSFELLELRRFVREGQSDAEMLIVDCMNDGVPTRNEVGILYRERIGLIFYTDEKRMPDVRMLRKDFPATLHQNLVKKGEPASLCLYFEPWEGVQRSWTPQSHLNRLLWWLAETAQGTLHRDDQPVEQFYYRSPFEVVLPPDFSDKIQQPNLTLVLENVQDKVFVGHFLSSTSVSEAQPGLDCIVLALQPVVHSSIAPFPNILGVLEEQFEARGESVSKLLCAEIERRVNQNGVSKQANRKTLLILQIPIKRKNQAIVERVEHKAFCLDIGLGQLGEAYGILTDGQDEKYYKIPLFNTSSQTKSWGSIEIYPIEVSFALTRATAQRASNVRAETAEFSGVLAGVGALGSHLAEIWYREAWGAWTFADPDYIKPHNLARQKAEDFQVGQDKAIAIKQMVEAIYPVDYTKATAIVDSGTNWSNETLKNAVESADLVVDATTTLSVPRDLAIAPIKRAASVFLTPSGNGSVLLLENCDRSIRLDVLEAQYYEAILNHAWGEQHLNGHQGHLWVGAGCRDTSNVIPTDLIQLHSATLARHLRFQRENSEASIVVWEADPKSGSVKAHLVSIASVLTVSTDEWRIVWNDRLRDKVRTIRTANLPNETGGVLIGYIDQKLQTIFVVDVLAAPVDSVAEPSGFTRGTHGLKVQIQTAQTRTAQIVSYIGEWHSHPPRTSSQPSCQDIALLMDLTETMQRDGLPVVMLIVGEDNETWSIGQQQGN